MSMRNVDFAVFGGGDNKDQKVGLKLKTTNSKQTTVSEADASIQVEIPSLPEVSPQVKTPTMAPLVQQIRDTLAQLQASLRASRADEAMLLRSHSCARRHLNLLSATLQSATACNRSLTETLWQLPMRKKVSAEATYAGSETTAREQTAHRAVQTCGAFPSSQFTCPCQCHYACEGCSRYTHLGRQVDSSEGFCDFQDDMEGSPKLLRERELRQLDDGRLPRCARLNHKPTLVQRVLRAREHSVVNLCVKYLHIRQRRDRQMRREADLLRMVRSLQTVLACTTDMLLRVTHLLEHERSSRSSPVSKDSFHLFHQNSGPLSTRHPSEELLSLSNVSSSSPSTAYLAPWEHSSDSKFSLSTDRKLSAENSPVSSISSARSSSISRNSYISVKSSRSICRKLSGSRSTSLPPLSKYKFPLKSLPSWPSSSSGSSRTSTPSGMSMFSSSTVSLHSQTSSFSHSSRQKFTTMSEHLNFNSFNSDVPSNSVNKILNVSPPPVYFDQSLPSTSVSKKSDTSKIRRRALVLLPSYVMVGFAAVGPSLGLSFICDLINEEAVVKVPRAPKWLRRLTPATGSRSADVVGAGGAGCAPARRRVGVASASAPAPASGPPPLAPEFSSPARTEPAPDSSMSGVAGAAASSAGAAAVATVGSPRERWEREQPSSCRRESRERRAKTKEPPSGDYLRELLHSQEHEGAAVDATGGLPEVFGRPLSHGDLDETSSPSETEVAPSGNRPKCAPPQPVLTSPLAPLGALASDVAACTASVPSVVAPTLFCQEDAETQRRRTLFEIQRLMLEARPYDSIEFFHVQRELVKYLGLEPQRRASIADYLLAPAPPDVPAPQPSTQTVGAASGGKRDSMKSEGGTPTSKSFWKRLRSRLWRGSGCSDGARTATASSDGSSAPTSTGNPLKGDGDVVQGV